MRQQPYNSYPQAYSTTYNLKDETIFRDVPIWSKNDVRLFHDGNTTPTSGIFFILSDGTVSGVMGGRSVSGFINRTTNEITFTTLGFTHGSYWVPSITYTGAFSPQLYDYTATGKYSDTLNFIHGTWVASFMEFLH
ncbi:hypothetical protein [Bacillus sp. RB3]|uniref:hypothetical protein n=1 Tax=Bacillus sp. RB3 TaxID=3050012 RepID=UPI00253F72A5|nr:hypothetical protein [Bacillus sp. RB3]MDK3014482.1 hypothetical protein [Bacillus sp. RB3]